MTSKSRWYLRCRIKELCGQRVEYVFVEKILLVKKVAGCVLQQPIIIFSFSFFFTVLYFISK